MPSSPQCRALCLAALGGAAGLALIFSAYVMLAIADAPNGQASREADPRIALAVLGDSDSHSYHDRLAFGVDLSARGGVYRHTTFSWPEVLARLRGDHLNLGDWGVWGNRHASFALVREMLGLTSRLPRKEDYRHNFAVSGAKCEDLIFGPQRQAHRLLALMDDDPDQWASGLIVVRTGINSFGDRNSLTALARDPRSAPVFAKMDACINTIRQTVELISERHPQARFVLVGIFNNANWAPYLEEWQSASEMQNILLGLDHFDHALRSLADTAPNRRLFFDDQAWFQSHWGARDTQGRPEYRDVWLRGVLGVSNSAGDAPSNAVVSDGHAGTVWSGLWAQALVELLNESFGLSIPPISETEILSLLDEAAGGVRSSQ